MDPNLYAGPNINSETARELTREDDERVRNKRIRELLESMPLSKR